MGSGKGTGPGRGPGGGGQRPREKIGLIWTCTCCHELIAVVIGKVEALPLECFKCGGPGRMRRLLRR